MMFLFRSTFITAVSAFVVALFLFSKSASAVPQFGRPMLHALDAVTSISGAVEAVPTSAVTGTSTDPDPGNQVIEATSSSSASSAATTPVVSSTSTNSASSTATTTPAAGSTSTNGASKSLCGGMSVMLGVVVSGVWLVF
ncbi:hypothetical protein BDR04DRAFT_128004 [Suillus decipiens]|nr:hypothetical protein BDR04DRAFT_128004 [Suillus decipiens]